MVDAALIKAEISARHLIKSCIVLSLVFNIISQFDISLCLVSSFYHINFGNEGVRREEVIL